MLLILRIKLEKEQEMQKERNIVEGKYPKNCWNKIIPVSYTHLDTKKGLNWYDYGARHYDAALGRFTTVDHSVENYYSTSPFTYCLNNSLNYIVAP